MEQLADDLSRITLGPEVSTTYEQAFDKIVTFAKNVRRHRIPPDELCVTKILADPFTPGGLLVLLTEPRQKHPWNEGVDRVIATCNSLDSLNEGIQIGSKGTLSLKNSVSVLDLRPFLPKQQYPTIKDDRWKELYELVFSAIEAKQPDVLLCMGDEARNALEARMGTQADFRQRYHGTEIVYAMHPSRSVNYEKTKLKIREKLFQSICEACGKLSGGWDESVWKERFLTHPLTISEVVPASESRFEVSENTRCLESFLDVIMRSCFLPRHQLPDPIIVMGGCQRYRLEEWQENWFRHMENYQHPTEDYENHARTLLIPVFKQFNRSLRRTSWFLPIYKVVDWPGVCQAFEDRLLEIEYACYLLAGNTEVVMDWAAGRIGDGSRHGDTRADLCHALTKMEEITTHATKLWEDRGPHPQRTGYYVGFVEEA